MKKYYILVIFAITFACNSNSSSHEEVNLEENITLTKEEKIIQAYNQRVLPLFKAYTDSNVPTEFIIDNKDLSIDAGAAFGYVEVSQGLVNLSKEHIKIFALCHEVAHIVTISQAKKFNLGESIPKGALTNDYIKAEYLADLIAIYLIKTEHYDVFNALMRDKSFLQNLLGSASFTHPSGNERIDFINTYIENSKLQGDAIAFKTSFLQVWYME